MTKTEAEWCTPILAKGSSIGRFGDHWYVARVSSKTGKDRLPLYVRYLHKDGTWREHLDTGTLYVGTGGTYFPTLQEVINVLCEHEINVVGIDEEE